MARIRGVSGGTGSLQVRDGNCPGGATTPVADAAPPEHCSPTGTNSSSSPDDEVTAVASLPPSSGRGRDANHSSTNESEW
mmetsp:Transcript_64733/g.114740  ORF Transcript_64733/g.114740 Transcript_64733/m.114740 type:complete len:80 (-) Transcript_64733:209-448(-)